MGLILAVVFIGVFLLVALLLFASSMMGPSRSARQAVATLDSALKVNSQNADVKKVNLRKTEEYSSIPWLNRKLLGLEVAPYLRRVLAQAALKWSPGRLLMMTAAGLLLPSYGLYQFIPNFLVSLAAGVIVGSLPFAFVFFKRHRRFGAFEKELPEALDLMVSGLRAGHSLLAAMALVARECADPVGSEFKVCFEEQNYGLEMKTALDNLLIRVPIQDLKIVATAIIIQKESGGNLAEVLEKTAYIIRQRFRLKKQIQVHTAQGRLTGVVLTLMPIALGIGIYCVDPGMISILWHRPIGLKLLWGAAGLTAFGGFVIHRIVNIDV